MRDKGELKELSIGVVRNLMKWPRADLAFTGDYRLARVRVNSRAVASSKTLDAAKTMHGAFLGTLLSWHPLPRAPVTVEAAATLGGFIALVNDHMEDGYTPFGAFGVRHLQLGLSWRP